MEIKDYPAANSIKSNEARDYPIIRCEDCHQIPTINFKLDKREIQLKCEKEGKTKDIPIETFFESIKKYEDINCCQFCKKKNPSQKYYLCKTCQNKILCENCFNEHNKNDDVIRFNIDSTCKNHYNPFESYCPICKEHICSYCSIDHDESHETKEITLKKKLFKKNKIDGFKNTIKKIKSDKDKIEKQINLVIQELEEKIKFLSDLKKNFFESLNMKMKFVELILYNYEKKLANLDINYFIINNLENQIKFNLLELNLNKNDSLDKKIENITNYLSKNLNSQFNFDNKANIENENPCNNFDNDITDVDYEKLKEFKGYVIGFLDFNKSLLALYSSKSIFFISKNNYEKKFEINEFGLNEIKVCKKIDDAKILIYTGKNILIVSIVDNCDYIINKNIECSYDIYDFNSNLDLLCLGYREYYNSTNDYFIEQLLFPDYTQVKFAKQLNNNNYYQDSKLLTNNNSNFFCFSDDFLECYSIKNNKCSLKASIKIDIDHRNTTIIDLNNKFYCLNDKKKILLLNKEDLATAKTININPNNLGILKISDKLLSIFFLEKNIFMFKNYDILSDGIKWQVKNSKDIFEKNVSKYYISNDYILFYAYQNYQDECILFRINFKK